MAAFNEDGEVFGDFNPEDIIGGSSESQLPLFEGHRVPGAEIALTGKLDLSLYTSDSRALMEALSLGKRATIVVKAGDQHVEIDARVETRSYKAKGGAVTTTARLKIEPPEEI